MPDETLPLTKAEWEQVRRIAKRDGRDEQEVAGYADEEEIRAFCRGQIAHYKIPRYVRFVDEFPMTITGKVQKFRMREAAIEELGLNEAVTA